MNNDFIDKHKLKKISRSPFFFGLERLLPKQKVLYFDKENLYIEIKEDIMIYPLNSIFSVKKTYNKINETNIWEIRLDFKEKKSFRFMHNYSNFYDFLDMMRRKYPNVIKSKFNF